MPLLSAQGISTAFFILVSIHPKVNATTATEHIKTILDRLELISPDSPKLILGDFNHCSAEFLFF